MPEPEKKPTFRILRPEEIQSFPPLRDLTPEELVEAYAVSKAAFTAADLQEYTELDEGVPMEDLLKELDENQRQYERRSP
jgi:hypothetical protein